MRQPVLVAGLLVWLGATLLLGQLRIVRRPSLTERLRPYGPQSAERPASIVDLSSWRDVVGPLSRTFGSRLARTFGVSEDVGARLDRLHSDVDVTTFRVRQLGWSTAALAAGALAVALVRPPSPLALLLLAGAPLLGFLVVEQRLISASGRWQRRVFLELPVITEQLAMLITAGYSLGAALQRVAERGDGVCATDLRRVCGRVRQGLTEVDALREWAARAKVPALDRIVPVLALHEDTGDLGRLMSEEARAIRAAVHRDMVETMERRGQQVWVPVTVATLVPGVIFLAVPFTEALKVFSGS
jgi:tight adherence protein C